MPAAISSATWGDSPRKNHKTPSSGMVFFLPFQEIADVKAATFPICPLIKTKPAQTVLTGGTAPRKAKKRQALVTFSHYHIFLHKSTKNLYKLNVQKLFILQLES